MSPPDRPSQQTLTPESRREMLRAFGDRMLVKLTAMDDPEDMPGIERAVRVAAMIERLYSRCDRAETQRPDPRKLEADRANNTRDAIKARIHLAQNLKWGEERRKDLGPWWDAAETKTDAQTQALASAPSLPQTPAHVQTSAPAMAPTTPTASAPSEAVTRQIYTSPLRGEGDHLPSFPANGVGAAPAAATRRSSDPVTVQAPESKIGKLDGPKRHKT